MLSLATWQMHLRPLIRRPGTSALIVLTLALGIGVNAGMFSVFHQALMTPLAVPQPERLAVLESPGPKVGAISTGGTGPHEQVFSYPMIEDLQAVAPDRVQIAGHRIFGVNLAARGSTQSAAGALVTPNFFDVLGLVPAEGRLLRADGGETERAVVLSHAYWLERFGGDRSVLGETLVVNGQPLEIAGVAPAGFRGFNPFSPVDVFASIDLVESLVPSSSWGLESRTNYWIYMFARLAEGVSPEAAEAILEPAYRRIVQEIEAPLQQEASDRYLAEFTARGLDVRPAPSGQSNAFASARTPLVLLMAVAALVLLIACVNVANLLMAVGAAERGESAVRQALGAGRRHLLMRQVAQLAALGLAAAAVSIPIAVTTLRTLLGMIPGGFQGLLIASLDWRVIGASLAATGLALLLAGLLPVAQAFSTRPIAAIREQGQRASGGKTAMNFRSVLVTTQIAFSLALLVVSGLFIQSLANINRVDLGMSTERVATFSISPGRNGYAPEQSAEMFRRVESRLQALPNVSAASVSMVPLLTGSNWNSGVSATGYESSPETNDNSRWNAVGPAFFDTLSIPLLRGRVFETADTGDRPKVAIVNRAFADKFGLGDDPVGKRMAIGSGTELDREIVGLVADAHYSEVKIDAPPQFFLPLSQVETPGTASFYARADGALDSLAPAIRDVVAELDPNLPVDNFAQLDVVVDQNVFLDRLIGTLSSAFALLATALASVGLFGVLSFTLAQRTGEIGLRAALGASPGVLKRMVLGQTLKLAALGGVIGLALAWLLARLASGLLYELSPLAPGVMAGAVAVLLLVTLAAGWIPARRAARVHPVEALRYQ
jgi:predicted permease